MGTRSRIDRTRRARRGAFTSLFCLLLLFSVAFGQAGLTAWAGGLSLSMGQSKAGSGSVAKSSTSGSTASALTTAAATSVNVNLDQFANLPGQGWQNGDLNGNNSAYGEGDVVPFRLAIEGLTAGQHTIHLNYDFLTGGSEAYDFLATWNVTENPNKCADPSAGGASSHCPNSLGSANTTAFPGDPFSPSVSPGLTVNGAMAFSGVSRNLTMYGGTVNSITVPAHASGKGDMVVTFTTSSDWAFFLWGAHIAQSAYWNESNGGSANGAATISGAPWHMRTQALDESNGNKNQDRSIQPSAIAVVQPNISVTKTADQGTINAGDTAAFTIVVTNNGPGTANNVTVNDPLPAGVAWAIDPAVTGCSITSGTLSCTFATLDEGASKTIHVSGVTDAQDCGTLSNTATVAADNEGSDQTDNSDTATITVQCATIQVTKTPDQGTVSAGDTIGFTITASNSGAGSASGVTVTDTLPTDAGLSWTIDAAGSDSGCSIAAGVLTCNFGTIAAGGSKHVHITSPTTPATCGSVDNTANVTTSNDGADSDNATITVNCPNVTVLKTADQGTIDAGDTAAFTIVVTNEGPGTAKGVTLTDTLPSGVVWSEDSAACSITAGVLSCNFGDLTDGATRTVHVTGVTDAADCGVLTNTAVVAASNESQADSQDNTSTATITVNCPNVTVLKTADQGTIDAGDTAAFTIVVTNEGPGTAKGVTLTDTLPSGVVWSEDSDAANSDAGCSITSGVLTCDFGDLGPDESKSVHIVSPTTAQSCGDVVNTASGTSSNDGQDSDSATVTVNCNDIFVTKTADAPLVEGGDTIGFLITVGNNGPGTANGVTLTDTLPTNGGLAWSIDLIDGQAPGSEPPCSITDGVLTCDFGSLESGASHTVHITSPTNSTTSCGAVNNTVTVDALNEPNTPEFTANDQASASLTVICPGISIVKTVNPVSGNPGDTVTYTYVVKNTGDATLFNVSVDDDVIGHIGDIAKLEPGETVTLTKDFVLPAGDPEVTNVGTATGTDVLGTKVSDNDDAFVTIVKAENPPPAPPPTAFTGSDAARLGLIAGVLLALGLLGIVLGRKRREA
jgi:uncharacterized repeat protein (TIGR01451 family)